MSAGRPSCPLVDLHVGITTFTFTNVNLSLKQMGFILDFSVFILQSKNTFYQLQASNNNVYSITYTHKDQLVASERIIAKHHVM